MALLSTIQFAVAQYPQYPSEHEHIWDAGSFPDPPLIIEKEDVRCGEVIEIGVGSCIDFDTCIVTEPACSFPNNEAENAVDVIDWDDGGAGGAFGHIDEDGNFVEGEPITHYCAPLTPGQDTVMVTVNIPQPPPNNYNDFDRNQMQLH